MTVAPKRVRHALLTQRACALLIWPAVIRPEAGPDDATATRTAFEAETRTLCRQGARVFLCVSLALAPLFALLDFHRFPDVAPAILRVRGITALVNVGLLLLLGRPRSVRYTSAATLVSVGAIVVGLGMQSALTGWHASPYVRLAPAALVMVAFLVPLPLSWMTALCIQVTGLYLIATLATGTADAPRFVDNAFFLVMASGIAIGSSLTRRRLHWSELSSRLATQRTLAALEESEARFRTMADSAPALIWVAGPDLETNWVNHAWREFTGTSTEHVGRTRWRELVHPDDQEHLRRALIDALERREPFRHEFRLRRFDGVYRWMLGQGAPRLGPGGRFESFVGSTVDISDQKEAAAALAAARDQAIEATRLKSEFLANMSHEIRSPMTAVIGMAELVLSTDLDPRQRAQVERIQASALSLLAVLNDVLDFSRGEAGTLDLESVPFDLAECVHGALRPLAPQAERKGIELACHLAPNAPQRVVGDPARLQQVIGNLVSNGIKFTERGEVVLRVQPASNGGLQVSVTDTGIGIPPEKHELVFAAFAQGDGSTTRRHGGTGLGLPICRQLVGQMGGTIGLESEPTRGSTFHVTVPLATAPALVAAVSTVPAGLRVLVVEDSDTSREILTELLRAGGALPTGTASAPDALAALAAAARDGAPFELVITDLHMPGMDGFALAGAIRALPAPLDATPIVLASAGLAGPELDRCRELGIAGPLAKPVRGPALLDAVARALASAAPTGAPAPVPAPLPRLAVLVADDDVVIRQLVTALLVREGHHVTAVEDGVRALAALEHGGFDLVLLDVDMPVLSGATATAQLRARGDRVPVIGLVSSRAGDEAARYCAAGMNAVVAKPLRRADLVAAIDAVLAAGPAAVPPDAAAAEAALDHAWVLEQANNDPDVLLRLVGLFLDDSRSTLDVIRQALEADDGHGLERAAHRLKGALGMMGARPAARAAAALEEAGRRRDLTAADTLVAALERDLARLEPEFTALTERPAPA